MTEIGGNAFDSCTSLKTVRLPDSTKLIGWEAFSGCTSLTSITIPKRVTSLGAGVFRGCTSLKTVHIDNPSLALHSSVFAECPSLTSESKQIISEHTSNEDTESPSSASKKMTWPQVVKELSQVYDYDPLYELREPEEEYLAGVMAEVEDSLGIWLEPSIQHGMGGIWFYSTDDDHTVAENYDYETLNNDAVDMAINSKTKKTFMNKYKSYLQNILNDPQYAPEED